MGDIGGVQTFLIECNRGNSLIDATAPVSQNAKWTTKTDFQFKRGDRVSVEAIMIESTGAGSSQQTIEFSGENIRQGDKLQNWTDDTVILEFGFYINNNGTTTINLPVEFPHNIDGGTTEPAGVNLRVNLGTNSALPSTPGDPTGPDAYQYPGCSYPQSAAANPANAGYNFKTAGGNETAYNLHSILESDGTAIGLPAAALSTVLQSVVISKAADAGTVGLTCEYEPLSLPVPQAYNVEGLNLPFTQGLQLIIKNTLGDVQVLGTIKEVVPNIVGGVGTGRAEIKLVSSIQNTIDIDANSLLICSCSNDDANARYGYSENPLAVPGITNYSPGARLGIGLYNGSAPALTGVSYSGLVQDRARLRGGAFLWEQTRIWGAANIAEVPALGCSTTTTPATTNGARELKSNDLRNLKDNAPYILVSPEYQGPQPTPNGQAMCPKLQPMTAYVVIRAENAFEDVNNLADKFTQAFHAINPLLSNKGNKLQEYIDNGTFPFNKKNNVFPLNSTGYFPKSVGSAAASGYTNKSSALFNNASPLFIGNCIKCLPSNMTTGPDWKYQAGSPYYYLPNDEKDYLKSGWRGNWNWNNIIYGNMGLKNFRKCWGGDRFIRVKCWDGNVVTGTAATSHKDIPRPVILNTQLRKVNVTTPPTPLTNNPFTFSGTHINQFECIFTNIEYTTANLDIIQEVFRECEDFIAESPNAPNDLKLQQNSSYWSWEADLGMSDGSRVMNDVTTGGMMNALQTNWIVLPPANATAGANPSSTGGGSVITPSQSFAGNGGEVNIQSAREVGRINVFTRWFEQWERRTDEYGPLNPLEEAQVGNGCKIYSSDGVSYIYDITESKERNIGVVPYQYTDDAGTTHQLCGFVVSKTYKPESFSLDANGEQNNGKNTWTLGEVSWGDFFGFSPQYGYDQPAIIPVNPQNIKDRLTLTTPDSDPQLMYIWNNQNVNWVGANDAELFFDNEKNRFVLKQLYTKNLLSFLNARDPTSPTPATPQVGEVMTTLNTNENNSYPNMANQFQPQPTNKPADYETQNTGLQDSVTGVYLNNIYFAPKGWTPPTSINAQNVYNPYAGYNYNTGDYREYLNQTTENRNLFLAELTKATADNWSGCLLDKMGFDYYQFKPPYGSQENRYSEFTFGRTDVEYMYQGKKPFMLNAQLDTADNLAINIYTYNSTTDPASNSAADGTPLYTNGLLNNNPVNIGDTQSAVLSANRIPTLFACPFYVVLSDICPTEFQSGNFKQECIFYGLKNYGAGQYFYVFGSNYSQLVDTDRTITQINTEIRNPLTGRLARLSKNSCIIYKVERNITLPPIQFNVNGEQVPIQETAEQKQEDEMTGLMNELKKLVSVNQMEASILSSIQNRSSEGVADFHTNLRRELGQTNQRVAQQFQPEDFGGALQAQEFQRSMTEETKEGKEEAARTEIDFERFNKDITKVLIRKALRLIPLTPGTIGNPVVISTAIKNLLDNAQKDIPLFVDLISKGTRTIDSVLSQIANEPIDIGVRGQILRRRRRQRQPVQRLEGNYTMNEELLNNITNDILNNEGININNLVEQGVENNEIRQEVTGEEGEPATTQDLQAQRNRSLTIQQRREAVARRFQDIQDAQALAPQVAETETEKIIREREQSSGKPLSNEEKKEIYDAQLEIAKKSIDTNVFDFLREATQTLGIQPPPRGEREQYGEIQREAKEKADSPPPSGEERSK